jgi:DNA-binding SARP family transcriptional activator
MEFRILGPIEVVDGDHPLSLKGSRVRALLALLLTSANEVVSADRLIDELWGAQPPRAASNALQYHVSQLRKALAPADVIVTREPGYLISVEPDQLDLLRFERLVGEAQDAPAEAAVRILREALGLWRGPALADLAGEAFAQAEIRRLEELRLVALERRIDADLILGRRAELVGELEALVGEHPFRETLRAQLMLALYGSGRQSEALDLYRETRTLLVEELGLQPGPALQQLEQAILRQDPSLDSPVRNAQDATRPADRSIAVVVGRIDRIDRLLAIAEPLARNPPRELILGCLLKGDADVAAATAELGAIREGLADRGVSSRVAAYTTVEPGREAALLATHQDCDLLLLSEAGELRESAGLDSELLAVFEDAPCDVAVLSGSIDAGSSGPVVTPFGGVDNDWSAIELAAWLARSVGTTLRLVGTQADGGRRDASRLLARASMLVQQVVGIVTEPVLVAAGADGVLEAARDARLLVVGLSERWRTEGIGAARLGLAAAAPVPTLFVRRGLRPGGVAPSETLTHFTWTLASDRAP